MSNYSDLVNVEDLWNKKTEFKDERWDITFYCKDCRKIVETERPNPNGYTFICSECKWKNIAIWTLEWVKETYKIK